MSVEFTAEEFLEVFDMYDMINAMSMEEFDEWLRMDIYGNVSPEHKEEPLLFVMNKLNDKKGFEDKLIYTLKLLSKWEKSKK
jgi:hypothetical protein